MDRNYNTQRGNYGTQRGSYGARDNAPRQGYNAPRQGYNNARQGYGAPRQGYNSPRQGYNTPRQGYSAAPGPSRYSNRESEANTNASTELYMGDLAPEWDEAAVRGVWSGLGLPPRRVKVVWQPGRAGAQHQGYCFVEFSTAAEAERALAMAGQPVPGHEGKWLRLNWAAGGGANGPTANGSGAGSGAGGARGFSVFVGDLQPSVTEEALLALFQQRLPSAEHARVVRDQQTGAPRGFGFVRFAAEADQQRALREMQGAVLNGRAIKVGSASGSNSSTNSSGGASSTTAPRPRRHRAPRHQLFALPQQQQPPVTHYTDRGNATLYAAGLPAATGPRELEELFAPLGELTLVRMASPPAQGAVVQYLSRRAAERALRTLQAYPLDAEGHCLRLSWGSATQSVTTTNSSPGPAPALPAPLYAPLGLSPRGA